MAFIAQFAETGYARMASEDQYLWYRSRTLDAVQKALAPDVAVEKREADLAKAAADFEDKSLLAVFVPLEQDWPTMNDNSKNFRKGYFKGWVILVDTKKFQPLAQTVFEAQSSATVRNTRLKLAGCPSAQAWAVQ